MDNNLLHIKEKIDKRFSKLCNEKSIDSGNELKIFCDFLFSNPFIQTILETLLKDSEEYIQALNKTDTIIFNPQNEYEKQYMSYALIKKCIENPRPYPQWHLIKKFDNKLRNMDTDESIKYFNSKFVQTIIEFIKESIDESNSILLLLIKYKQKCEWFRRAFLNNLIKDNSTIAENILSKDLYEYLFDNGIQINIEPKSASGRADLISSQTSQNRLLADVKIFNPAKSKDLTYIAKGFNQVYHYTQDYNEPIGYLTIFKTCEEDLNFSLTNTANHIPYLVYNNKIIYAITIDIYDYEKTASKRGKPICYKMDENFIVKIISNS